MYSTSDISQTHTNIIIIHIKLKFENFIICKLIIYFFPHMRKHFTLYIRIRQKYILKQKYYQSTNTSVDYNVFIDVFFMKTVILNVNLKWNITSIKLLIQLYRLYWYTISWSYNQWKSGEMCCRTLSHIFGFKLTINNKLKFNKILVHKFFL